MHKYLFFVIYHRMTIVIKQYNKIFGHIFINSCYSFFFCFSKIVQIVISKIVLLQEIILMDQRKHVLIHYYCL